MYIYIYAHRYHAAQPALIYLIPATLGPTVVMGWSKGDLGDLWHGVTLQKADEPDVLVRHEV